MRTTLLHKVFTNRFLLLCLSVLALIPVTSCKKKAAETAAGSEKTVTEDGYTYSIVEGDPTKTRIYTLANGLKVYLSVYKDAPRVQTLIVVKAGSKNDPATATGLAHYLEHMLFKGTSKLGSDDWAKEKPLLDSIENLFEKYRATTNPDERKKIYAQIDQTSGAAAKFAVANEYDKLTADMGAQGTNAFTTNDFTGYITDIPANNFDKWIELEGERFSELTPRLFHTELEAVYEEKNRGLDNDGWQVQELLYKKLMPVHPYGSQTTIGTIEHLKNPSVTEIKKYFYANYVPNNMAICLSGDLDPAKTIKSVDKFWGKMKSKDVAKLNVASEKPIAAPLADTVIGPQEESITLGYRLSGINSPDDLLLQLCSGVLGNGRAGLIDLNLNTKQRVREAQNYADRMVDYSILQLQAKPRTGQSLDEVRALLLAQTDSLKQGRFDDNLLKAVINNRKIDKTKATESNQSRAFGMLEAFAAGRNWADVVSENDRLSKITKAEVVAFANKNFGDNYAVIYKKSGKNQAQKVDKPVITPVEVNREKASAYFKQLQAQQAPAIEPVFTDFKKEIQFAELPSKAKVLYRKNEENGLFTMYYLLETGSINDPKLALAVKYLKFLGTKNLSPEALQQQFYRLGSSFDVFASKERIFVIVSGLEENFDQTLNLLEGLLKDPQPNAAALTNLIADEKREREDAKKDKNAIRRALTDYARYGAKNPSTTLLSNAELDALKPEDLTEALKGLTAWQHDILYYGPRDLSALTATLNEKHSTPATLKPVPAEFPFKEEAFDKNKVLFANFDMVQAEIVFVSKSTPWNRAMYPEITLFNEYFGGGMGSLVFQDLRESKALAYSTYATYTATDPKKSNFVIAYIGSQADKLHEAAAGMQNLINDMPLAEGTFNVSKKSIEERMRSERVTKSDILFAYVDARKKGLDTDMRQEIYEKVQKLTKADVKAFQEKYLKNQKTTMVVVAGSNKIKVSDLKRYGELQVLSLQQVFGY